MCGSRSSACDRLAAVVRECDVERALLELHLDDAADVRLIIGHQHVDALLLEHAQTSDEMFSRLRRSSNSRRPMFADGCASTRRSASVGEQRDDGNPLVVFEHGGVERAARIVRPEFLGGRDDRRHERGHAFRVHRAGGLAIDQKSVAAEHDGRIDAFALAKGAHEISNGGHARSWWVVRNYGRRAVEVKLG